MGIEHIRNSYHVLAKIGGRVKFRPCRGESAIDGVIIGSRGQYLRVKFKDGEKLLHPTWEVEYEA